MKPIFVVGPPRTGTTLLGRLLAANDAALSLSEPFHLKDLLPHPPLRAFYWNLQRINGLKPVPLPRVATYEQYFAYLKDLARANGFRYLVIKEVFHELGMNPPFANLNLLDGMAARGFPMVAIVRHPWDAAASTVRLLCRLFFGAAGNLIRSCWPAVPRFKGRDEIARWSAKNWAHFVDWTRQRGLFVVRYEDLVKRPADSLQRICEYTGLPFDERMLEHHRHRPKVFGGIGAPEVLFHRAKPVHPGAIGRGRHLTAAQRCTIARLCADRAAILGYALEARC